MNTDWSHNLRRAVASSTAAVALLVTGVMVQADQGNALSKAVERSANATDVAYARTDAMVHGREPVDKTSPSASEVPIHPPPFDNPDAECLMKKETWTECFGDGHGQSKDWYKSVSGRREPPKFWQWRSLYSGNHKLSFE